MAWLKTEDPLLMAIYGTALLCFCLLAGLLGGKFLGWLLGLQANVGGVGLAMLLLIWLMDRLKREGRFSEASEKGVEFWGAIYLPVTVAMATCQNVRAALSGGMAAIFAGLLSVVACVLLVPLLVRSGGSARVE